MVKPTPTVGMLVRLCDTWNRLNAPVGSTGVVEQILDTSGYEFSFYVTWGDPAVQNYAGSHKGFWFSPSDWRDYFEVTGDGPW